MHCRICVRKTGVHPGSSPGQAFPGNALDIGCELGAGGGTRTPTGLPPTDFRTSYGFRRRRIGVCGLDYPFTVATRLRCCPSSLYTFPNKFLTLGLGSGLPCQRFPRIWAVLRPRFPEAHSNCFKSVASTVPPRPRNRSIYAILGALRLAFRQTRARCFEHRLRAEHEAHWSM